MIAGRLRAGDLLDRLHHGPHRRLGGGELRRPRLLWLDHDRRLWLDVDRQHQHDGTPLGHRPVIRALRVVGRRLRAVDPVGDRSDGFDEVVLVDPEVAGQRRGWCLSGEDEQRRSAFRRLGQSGHRVRQARALVNADDAESTRAAGVAVGHAHRASFMPRVVKARAAPAQRIRDDEVAAAEHAERVPDTLRGDRHADDIGNRRLRHTGATVSGPTGTGLPSGWHTTR